MLVSWLMPAPSLTTPGRPRQPVWTGLQRLSRWSPRRDRADCDAERQSLREAEQDQPPRAADRGLPRTDGMTEVELRKAF